MHKEQELWLEKFAELGVPQLLIEESGITEEDYQTLYEKLSLVFSKKYWPEPLKITKPWQLYALLGRMTEAQDAREQEIVTPDNWNMSLDFYAIISGNQSALNWVQQNSPEFLTHYNDSDHCSVVRLAALSHNLPALELIKQTQTELLYKTNAKGHTIAHMAASLGNLPLLDWIKHNLPELLKAKDKDGYNIAHIATWSNNAPALLGWIKKNQSALLKGKDSSGLNIAHLAGWTDNAPLALGWIQENQPALLKGKDFLGCTIAHVAVRIGKRGLPMLAWIQKNQPALLEEKTTPDGCTIAHLAVQSNDPFAQLAWIQQYQPALLKEKDKKGHTIADLIPQSGDQGLKTLLDDWLSGKQPYLILDSIGRSAATLMQAAKEGSNEAFTQALADFKKLDPATRANVMKRCVTLDGDNILHTICKASVSSNHLAGNHKLEGFAQQGGMLLASEKNAEGKTPAQYLRGREDMQIAYRDADKNYTPLATVFQNYQRLVQQEDKSSALLLELLNAKSELEKVPKCTLAQQIKKDISSKLEHCIFWHILHYLEQLKSNKSGSYPFLLMDFNRLLYATKEKIIQIPNEKKTFDGLFSTCTHNPSNNPFNLIRVMDSKLLLTLREEFLELSQGSNNTVLNDLAAMREANQEAVVSCSTKMEDNYDSGNLFEL